MGPVLSIVLSKPEPRQNEIGNILFSSCFLRTILIIVLTASATLVCADEYLVRVDARLATLQVEARFDSPVFTISARARDAGQYLRAASDCNSTLEHRSRRLLIPESGIRCLQYSVDLRAAAAAERRNRTLADDNLLVAPAVWLWLPPLNDQRPIHVRFETAEPMQVAVPWARIAAAPHSYRLEESPKSGWALAAFGQFEVRELNIDGGRLRIHLLQGEQPYAEQAIAEWVADTVATVRLAYGRFPNPNASVTVIPVGKNTRSNNPVIFGRLVRDSGESVELLVDEHAPIEEFAGDWTAVHEFSHLMLPYVNPAQRWISEGFAQYYQNVLLARAGHYSEAFAWQKLYEGLQRGQASMPEASPNEAARGGNRDARMKIYWAGAALALRADVELRRRSNGQESLDSVLSRLEACCLPSATSWSGTQLMRKLDTLTDLPVFVKLYDQIADTAGFPDTTALFADLGVRVTSGDVKLEESAPLAALRRSISGLAGPGR